MEHEPCYACAHVYSIALAHSSTVLGVLGLPTELLRLILLHLRDPRDVWRARCVCKAFDRIVMDAMFSEALIKSYIISAHTFQNTDKALARLHAVRRSYALAGRNVLYVFRYVHVLICSWCASG